MFPWDFNNHLDSLHRKCEVCQLYVNGDEELRNHMEIEHPTTPQSHIETEPQITTDPASLDTSHQDHQVK